MKEAIQHVLVFVILQVLTSIFVGAGVALVTDNSTAEAQVLSIVAASGVSSLVIMAVFLWRKWWTPSLDYIKSRPYSSLLLVLLCALGSVLPSAVVMENLPEAMQEDNMEGVFTLLLENPLGYVVIGIIAPFIEELVFRGAVLRALLRWQRKDGIVEAKGEWTAIVISALLFSLIHMNPAQMPHAFVIGMLLGWLYSRSGSIVPSMLFHWINNSLAFLVAVAFPELPYDAKVIELFGGNYTAMSVTVGVSFVVFAVSLCLLARKQKTEAVNVF